MTEQTAIEGASGDPPTGDPSSPDERIKGLQRLVTEKSEESRRATEAAAAMTKRIEEYELAQLSEVERGTYLSRREQSKAASLAVENEQLKMALKYPDVADDMRALFAATTLEDQVKYLRRLRNPKATTTVADEPSDVDPNNPMRGPNDRISLPYGTVDSDAAADAILKAFDRPLRGR